MTQSEKIILEDFKLVCENFRLVVELNFPVDQENNFTKFFHKIIDELEYEILCNEYGESAEVRNEKLDYRIDKIREKIKIEDVISRYTPLSPVGDDVFTGQCPFCDASKFQVNAKKQIFYCTTCNCAGDVITFYQILKKMTPANILLMLESNIAGKCDNM